MSVVCTRCLRWLLVCVWVREHSYSIHSLLLMAPGLSMCLCNSHFLGLTNGPVRDNFELAQYHFHWGADNKRGSEHTVDGRFYPNEVSWIAFGLQVHYMYCWWGWVWREGRGGAGGVVLWCVSCSTVQWAMPFRLCKSLCMSRWSYFPVY